MEESKYITFLKSKMAIAKDPDYFRDGVGYCKAEEEEENLPTLFDLIEDNVSD